ncbi:MAG: DUF883 family protein [Steroidobacteraceae bacterium]
MAKRATKQTKATIGDTAAGLQTVIDSAEELLESLRDQHGAAVDQLRAKLSATIKSTRERLGEAEVPELAAVVLGSTLRFLRRDLWRSVALIALAALAVSSLLGRGSEG